MRRTAKEFHKLHSTLKNEVIATYNHLVENNPSFNFVDETEWDLAIQKKDIMDVIIMVENLPVVDILNSNCDVVESYILSISKDGIYVSERDNPKTCRFVGYRDVADLYQMIDVVEEMEEHLKEKSENIV